MKKFLALLLVALLGIMPALAEESSPLADDSRTVSTVSLSIPDMGDFQLVISEQTGNYPHLTLDLLSDGQPMCNLGGMLDMSSEVLYVWTDLLLNRPIALDAEDMELLTSMISAMAESYATQMMEESDSMLQEIMPELEAKLPALANIIKTGDVSALIDPETGEPDLMAILGLFGIKPDQIDASALLETIEGVGAVESAEIDPYEVPGGAVAVAEERMTVTGADCNTIVAALIAFVEANKDALGILADDDVIDLLKSIQLSEEDSVVINVGSTADNEPAYVVVTMSIEGIVEKITMTMASDEEGNATVTEIITLQMPDQEEQVIATYNGIVTPYDETMMAVDISFFFPDEEPMNFILTVKSVETGIQADAAFTMGTGEEAMTINGIAFVGYDPETFNMLFTLTVAPEGMEDEALALKAEIAVAEPVILIEDTTEVDFPVKMEGDQLDAWLGGVMERLAPFMEMFGVMTEEAVEEPAA